MLSLNLQPRQIDFERRGDTAVSRFKTRRPARSCASGDLLSVARECGERPRVVELVEHVIDVATNDLLDPPPRLEVMYVTANVGHVPRERHHGSRPPIAQMILAAPTTLALISLRPASSILLVPVDGGDGRETMRALGVARSCRCRCDHLRRDPVLCSNIVRFLACVPAGRPQRSV